MSEAFRPTSFIPTLVTGVLGKSTVLDLLMQQGRAAGPRVLVDDGDVRNPTLSGPCLPNNESEAASRPRTVPATSGKG